MLERLINAYENDSLRLLSQLHEAIDNEDGDSLASCAHSLKAGSANVGAPKLAAMYSTLEALGTAGDCAQAATLWPEIRMLHGDVEEALQKLKTA